MAASLSPRLASSLSSPNQKCRGFTICLISTPPRANLHFSNSIPQLGICQISSWNGLRQLNMPKSRFIVKFERKRRCKGVYASLFGVGAPEALVIGVVALLVFGPKGLAEVARNLGKTLRDFQPTIRELQEVSRDFKSTLEREIGLDEIQETTKPATRTRPTANSEDFVKANTPDSPPPLPVASLGGEDAKISEEQVEASAAELQVTDGSVLSKESETQEYLKQLEEQVQALLAEKQKKFAPAATEVKSQDTSSFSTEASFTEDNQKTKEQELEELAAQQQDETSLPTDSQAEPQSQSEDTSSCSTEASFMEEKLKTEELELEELASQPHDETPLSTESQAEPQSQSGGTEVTWNSKESETQEYLKKLEEDVQKLFTEKQNLTATSDVKPEDSQETASVNAPSQNSEANQA